MSKLPKWVYDILIQVQKYEEVHGSEIAEGDEYFCFGPALDKVPPMVRAVAAGVREYRESTGRADGR